ncbi:DUF6118 family protein [Phenylobacterium sp. LH3H17]|uniref:DUF6118 family protein n=1 Tax=Phenylobacterium sp. LH3H17 TaxID=2903901 RepID=UPI0020C97CBB|nr:DUF6118 family protein [Phenylobacterium sp. LH3H17]UTP40933.1 DUF6118 family protein [Phenylobacterium sp. LH3H17]
MNDDPATVAFEHLRSEVALLRRAIEGLSAQQPEPTPDYGPTLAKLQRAMGGLEEHVGQLAESPALALTPETVASQLLSHAAEARAEVRLELAQALSGLIQATSLMTKTAGLVRTGEAQRRRLVQAALAGSAVGLLAWVALSGPISRALPARWKVPERVAAAALGQDRWAAGARLMRGADDASWRRLRLGEDIVVQNRRVLDACWKRAERLGRPIACEVRIGG